MLRELRVRNFAVVEDVRLELGPGLNVLTGETGAGKSIIVGALSLLLGERATSDLVRAGEERALVEGAFDIGGRAEIEERLREAGLESEEGLLILRREVQREGRNRAWVNGSPATAGLIGELGAALVDLHGQHEHQALLGREAQRRILDEWAGAAGTASEVAAAWRTLRERREARDDLRRRAAETREKADFLRFRAEEIEKAELEEDEEEALEAEARRLEHSEDLLTLSGDLHEAVYDGEESLTDRLGGLRRALADLRRIDPDAAEFDGLYETARAALQELGRRLGEYHRAVQHDPRRLEEIRQRQDLLFRLKRKYGDPLAEVIRAGREARAELEVLASSDLELRGLERAVEEARSRLEERAGALSATRRTAAEKLEEAVTPLLAELGMGGAVFEVALEPLEGPGPHGAERVEFRVALNPGFPPAPLARVASGGELSRVMLALKTVLAAVDRVPSLVFDEIDAGVGGRVAHRVAARLADVADRHQVFAITHLPQIASRAARHLRVEKEQVEGRAATRVRELAGEERVEEVARMLGGDPESGVSRRHAEELLAGRTVGEA